MVDDNFTVNLKRTEDICDLIIKKSLKVSWDIKGRIDNINRTVLEKLSKAGCRRIQYGIETPNARIQKILNKNIDVETIRSVLVMTKRAGFDTYGDFMIGSPTETEEEILNTINSARRYPLDYAHFEITELMPGTRLYLEALQKNRIVDTWREYALNPQPKFQVPYCPDTLDPEHLQRLLNLAYRRFYLRPKKIMEYLIGITSWGELKRKMSTGIKIVLGRVSR